MSTSQIITSVVMAVSIFVTGCSKRHLTSSASMVVVPGASIGSVRLGMTMQQVIAKLGEPDKKEIQGFAEFEYAKLGLFVTPGNKGLVLMVVCVSKSGLRGLSGKAFAGHTEQGIGIGSSRADVIQAYGEPTVDSPDKTGHEFLKYSKLGLAFDLHDGKVDRMFVIPSHHMMPNTSLEPTPTRH